VEYGDRAESVVVAGRPDRGVGVAVVVE